MKSLLASILGGVLAAQAAAPLSAPDKQLLIPTTSGFVKLSPQETEKYIQVEEYLRERLREVESVQPGVEYNLLLKHFTADGGLSSPPPHRFVNILCPYIKIDVTFQGERELEPFAEIPADAAVAEVSRPYFEPPSMD